MLYYHHHGTIQKTEKGQGRFLTVSLAHYLLPGTFVLTLPLLFDEKLNLGIFDMRSATDQTGAAAREPRILLNIMLYCYSCGFISSRKIAVMYRSHLAVKPWRKTLNRITPPYRTSGQEREGKYSGYSAK